MKPHLTGKKNDVQNLLSIGSNYVSQPSAMFSILAIAPDAISQGYRC
jgi:hypothetical protein